jgi:hypothetical protein
VLPAGYEVDRKLGGLWGRTGVLGWWGKYLTHCVRSVPLMTAEDLPSSPPFLGGLWWFYLRREWQARVFGNAVARASEHPVQLGCQNRELAHVNGNNNITGVDFGRGGVVWFQRFLGRGRNGMWLSRLALFGSAFLVYVEPKLFFFFAWENSGVQPLIQLKRVQIMEW